MKNAILGSLLLASFGLSSATAGTASDPAPVVPDALKPVIQAGIEVLTSFDTPSGLKGWAIKNGSENNIIYTTPDGKYVMVGAMLDSLGRNVTIDHMKTYFPEPDRSAMWDSVSKEAKVVKTGASDEEAKSVIYVFMEPNCPYCNKAWKAFMPYMKQGLQIRNILVSFLRPDSDGKAAAIMESDDPAKAMAEHEAAFRSGGIAPIADPKPETLEAIRTNTKLMKKLGFSGTPGIVYKLPDGTVGTVKGMPKLGQIPKITGLAKIENNDPDLARFK